MSVRSSLHIRKLIGDTYLLVNLVIDENGINEMNYKTTRTTTTVAFFSFAFYFRRVSCLCYSSQCIRNDSRITRTGAFWTGRSFFDLTNRRNVQFAPYK